MRKFGFAFLTLLGMVVARAQETRDSATGVAEIEIEAGAWYTSPWVWVAGAALVLTLLLVLTRGGSRSSES